MRAKLVSAQTDFWFRRGVYDQFVQLLAEKTKALKMGDGMGPESQIGPLIGEEAVQKVSAHISDALASGGSLVAGGGRKGNTLFFTPTVSGESNARLPFVF
jgi:succinate-semialdehyde dehydrogenase/glutarate-semialdehyde dehydrogenase